MQKTKITFIIPVYNVEKYLRECLDSVVNQTLREIQIICVNDGSTDNSLAILNDYAARDQRITIINLQNGGSSIARNTAYDYIEGDYILFVDSDDFIDLTAADKLYEQASKTNADLVLFDMVYCNNKSVPYKFSRKFTQTETLTSFDQRAKLILDSTGVVWDKLYRSDLLLQNKIRFPEKLYGEDQAVTFLSLVAAKNITTVPESFYYYRMVADSISHLYSTHKRQTDTILVYAFIREQLNRLGLFDDFQDLFSIRKLHVFYRHFRRATYLSEKERIKIFRSNISEIDIQYFNKNQSNFKSNEKRVLSCIIENKPLLLRDKICDRLVRFTPLIDYCKFFLRCRIAKNIRK
jgi:glycosyltransferase involved in cell wall biosynthesis